ncbi:hypothetical protein Ahy_A07g032793 [Arachis hypogaea]|uniref:Uncharacterized protein n=1 Tax=Arachis hypogaea TaxID=3818 RepID=A0A445C7I7_ARAHY|nr:hypothetical protein Ahy_A07g032793 [Arachis hypogaea]
MLKLNVMHTKTPNTHGTWNPCPTIKVNKSKEEFEDIYQILGPNEDGDEEDIIVDTNVTDIVNALADRHLSGEPSFMHTLNLDTMYAPEFFEYVNADNYQQPLQPLVPTLTMAYLCGQLRALYVKFEKIVEVDLPELNIDWSVKVNKSKEEFEDIYQIIGPNEDGDEEDIMVDTNVTDIANALADRHPSGEPSFMHILNFDTMYAPKFLDLAFYDLFGIVIGTTPPVVVDVSLIKRQYCWVIRKYNGSHTCTTTIIFQDHTKLDSETIAEAINSLVEADPSLKVKYHGWLSKKTIEKIFHGWKAYKAFPTWFEVIMAKELSAAVDPDKTQTASLFYRLDATQRTQNISMASSHSLDLNPH